MDDDGWEERKVGARYFNFRSNVGKRGRGLPMFVQTFVAMQNVAVKGD